MRITDNSVYRNLTAQLQQGYAQQAKFQQQISSGQKITSPSDDPAAMGRVMSIRTEKSEQVQYVRNVERAEALTQATFAGVEAIQELALRAEEIASQSNDLMGSDGYAAYAAEVNELIEQVIVTANGKHLGDYLHSGAASDTQPYQVNTRDANGWITVMDPWAGSVASPELYIAPGSKMAPWAEASVNQEIHSLIGNLMSLRDALSAENATAVGVARTGIQTNEHELVKAMSDTGGKLSRLELARDMAEDRHIALEDTLSAEADADLVEAISELNRAQVAYQAAMQSGARLMRTSLLDYI